MGDNIPVGGVGGPLEGVSFNGPMMEGEDNHDESDLEA